MQAQPDVICLGQRSGPRQCAGNTTRGVELIEGVTAEWVSSERKDLTGDAERPDAELVTSLDCSGQGDGVVVGDVRQIPAPVLRRQCGDVAMSRCPELDGRVEELAAEAPAESGARSLEGGGGHRFQIHCHPERSEGSLELYAEGSFAALRMTATQDSLLVAHNNF